MTSGAKKDSNVLGPPLLQPPDDEVDVVPLIDFALKNAWIVWVSLTLLKV